jgi:hypothetical protein
MAPIACKGRVIGKTVLLDDGSDLPDGATVEVWYVPDRVGVASSDERQRALQRLLALDLPAADWETMEEEIERGAVDG